jgi:LacI family transcriptional regulator
MAVVSYDDIEFADVFRPGITAIAQPIKDIANLAVQLLIDRIRNKGKTSQPQTYILPTRFIHRDSCGCSTYSASEWAPD